MKFGTLHQPTGALSPELAPSASGVSAQRHRKAVLQALLVTFLWSTSWVLIKIGLQDLPALTFSSLRYILATLCLLPFFLRPNGQPVFQHLTRRDWVKLAFLGTLLIAVTQGAQYIGLAYLPAIMVSILLNFTTLLVAFLGIVFLREKPTWLQWAGTTLFLGGVSVYFYPQLPSISSTQWIGVGIVVLGVIGNALSSVLGRSINREGRLPALTVTVISMAIGSVLLLGVGLAVEGLPRLTLTAGLIIAWLAVVNTAFAFTLWNQTMRTLTAMESSMINSTMLVQIAILAWIFLGEALTVQSIFGLVLAGLGALLVQIRRNAGPKSQPESVQNG